MKADVLARVRGLDTLITELTSTRDRALAEAQVSCPHPVESMVYGEHRPNSWMTDFAEAPFLVCRDCGLAEEGWGFFDLFEMHYSNRDIPYIAREEAWKLVRTFRRRAEVSAGSIAKSRARRAAERGATS